MSTSTSNDPSGFITNPPTTIVKVMGTAREDVNGSLGIVVQFDSERGRYRVHLTATQQIVAMKPDNLVKANRIEEVKAQYQQFTNSPEVQRQIQQLTAQYLPTGVSLQQVGIGVGVLFLVLIYFLGFSRTMLLLSSLMLLGMVIGPDLATGDPQVIVRNAPRRFQTIVRDQMPGGQYIADKPYLLMGLAAFFLVFFVKGMMTPSSAAKSPLPADGFSATPQRQLMMTKTAQEYYKLGFDDATAGKDFGTSLPAEEPTTTGGDDTGTSRILGVDDEPHYYNLPPPRPSVFSKLFSLSNVMSVAYLGNTLFQLGRTAEGSWEFALMRANLATLEPWKLGLMGLSVYRIVSGLVS